MGADRLEMPLGGRHELAGLAGSLARGGSGAAGRRLLHPAEQQKKKDGRRGDAAEQRVDEIDADDEERRPEDVEPGTCVPCHERLNPGEVTEPVLDRRRVIEPARRETLADEPRAELGPDPGGPPHEHLPPDSVQHNRCHHGDERSNRQHDQRSDAAALGHAVEDLQEKERRRELQDVDKGGEGNDRHETAPRRPPSAAHRGIATRAHRRPLTAELPDRRAIQQSGPIGPRDMLTWRLTAEPPNLHEGDRSPNRGQAGQ